MSQPADIKKVLPDFSLLLSRLEKQILLGEKQVEISQAVKNERNWKALDIEMQLKWANLAQMAGDIDTACSVFAYINQTSPEVVEAWQSHLELLFVLGRKEEIAQTLTRSRKFVDEGTCDQWMKSFTISDRSVRV